MRAKGSPKPPGSGRKAGTPNKSTVAFKSAVLAVFHRMGEAEGKGGKNIDGEAAFLVWAKANPTDFYKIAARLIPHEVIGPGEGGAHVVKTIQHIHETVTKP